jgi:hypothetical protein
MFLPKRRQREASQQDEPISGALIQLFDDYDVDLLDSPEIPNSIKV